MSTLAYLSTLLHEDLLAVDVARRARARLTMFTCASKDTGGSRDTHRLSCYMYMDRVGTNNDR
jgi:hypothetical protein